MINNARGGAVIDIVREHEGADPDEELEKFKKDRDGFRGDLERAQEALARASHAWAVAADQANVIRGELARVRAELEEEEILHRATRAELRAERASLAWESEESLCLKPHPEIPSLFCEGKGGHDGDCIWREEEVDHG